MGFMVESPEGSGLGQSTADIWDWMNRDWIPGVKNSQLALIGGIAGTFFLLGKETEPRLRARKKRGVEKRISSLQKEIRELRAAD